MGDSGSQDAIQGVSKGSCFSTGIHGSRRKESLRFLSRTSSHHKSRCTDTAPSDSSCISHESRSAMVALDPSHVCIEAEAESRQRRNQRRRCQGEGLEIYCRQGPQRCPWLGFAFLERYVYHYSLVKDGRRNKLIPSRTTGDEGGSCYLG